MQFIFYDYEATIESRIQKELSDRSVWHFQNSVKTILQGESEFYVLNPKDVNEDEDKHLFECNISCHNHDLLYQAFYQACALLIKQKCKTIDEAIEQLKEQFPILKTVIAKDFLIKTLGFDHPDYVMTPIHNDYIVEHFLEHGCLPDGYMSDEGYDYYEEEEQDDEDDDKPSNPPYFWGSLNYPLIPTVWDYNEKTNTAKEFKHITEVNYKIDMPTRIAITQQLKEIAQKRRDEFFLGFLV